MNLDNQIPFFESIPMDNPDALKKKKKEINNIICEMLNELLSARDINLAKVVKDTGIPFTTLDDWANGRTTPMADENLIKLANYFEVTLEYLCFGIGPDMGDVG